MLSRLMLHALLFPCVWLLLGCAATPRSGATPTPTSDFGVLVMAHGGPPEWNSGVLETVKPLRAHYDIEVAFGMADAESLQEGVRKLEARGVHRIGVLRLFVSGESWFERTEQILGIKAGAPPHEATAPDPHAGHAGHDGHSMAFYKIASGASFAMSEQGLADADGMGAVLADHATALSKNPAKEDVLILAHGPEGDDENTRWLQKLDTRAATVRARAPFRRVEVQTLREDWPEKRVEAEKRIRAYVERAAAEGGTAIVVPFRVSGFGPYSKVLEGLTFASDGQGLILHAEVTVWLEKQAAALAAGAFRAPEK